MLSFPMPSRQMAVLQELIDVAEERLDYLERGTDADRAAD